MYKTEIEKQEEFIKAVGGKKNADRLNRVWTNSYPRFCSLNGEYPAHHTGEEIFRSRAKLEGFTDKMINLFLML